MKVVKFQESGFYSSSSSLKLRGGLPRSLRDFTLCARLSLNFLRGRRGKNYWLSVGNATHPDLLTGGIRCEVDLVCTTYYRSLTTDIIHGSPN